MFLRVHIFPHKQSLAEDRRQHGVRLLLDVLWYGVCRFKPQPVSLSVEHVGNHRRRLAAALTSDPVDLLRGVYEQEVKLK